MKMLKIFLLPKIIYNILKKLRNIIKNHNKLLMEKFSVLSALKVHIIMHYLMIIKKIGPPRTDLKTETFISKI